MNTLYNGTSYNMPKLRQAFRPEIEAKLKNIWKTKWHRQQELRDRNGSHTFYVEEKGDQHNKDIQKHEWDPHCWPYEVTKEDEPGN